MNIVFFDHPTFKQSLLPFTWIRPTAAIRIGILKIYEKWNGLLDTSSSFLTEPYLANKFPARYQERQLYINGALCPSKEIVDTIKNLKEGEALMQEEVLLAYSSAKTFRTPADLVYYCNEQQYGKILVKTDRLLYHPWDIFKNNRAEIIQDFELVTKSRQSEQITDPYTKVYAPENVFIEQGASIKAAIINAESGPVYIGKNAKIHEGAIIKGALALCEGAEINMGAKIRGDSTFGPYAKIGGEVSNTVVFGYSNKSHDGYLGNAVLGEWCNLGADTNSSNLKNNYSEVKVWDYLTEKMIPSSLQFCGLMMGDHSKCGINTMFNTGTLVGMAAIIFGSGFPKKFVPSFTWGGTGKSDVFQFEKMLELANTVMKRKGIGLTSDDKNIFQYVFEASAKYRNL